MLCFMFFLEGFFAYGLLVPFWVYLDAIVFLVGCSTGEFLPYAF